MAATFPLRILKDILLMIKDSEYLFSENSGYCSNTRKPIPVRIKSFTDMTRDYSRR